jgi:hypothetical protein
MLGAEGMTKAWCQSNLTNQYYILMQQKQGIIVFLGIDSELEKLIS